MQENELLDALCSEIGVVEDTDAALEGIGIPAVVTVFANLVLMKLRVWGCENKQTVLDQANAFIDRMVKNAVVAGMMKVALATAADAICG